jgi:hypothetical protein
MKLVAFGVRGYFKQRWNVFDVCLVLGAYVGFASSLPSIATLLRVFRVLRVVRLARGSKAMLQVRVVGVYVFPLSLYDLFHVSLPSSSLPTLWAFVPLFPTASPRCPFASPPLCPSAPRPLCPFRPLPLRSFSFSGIIVPLSPHSLWPWVSPHHPSPCL